MEEALRKAFEETINANLHGVVDYTKDTRKMVRELEAKVKGFENLLLTREAELQETKKQLALLQSKFYVYGTE